MSDYSELLRDVRWQQKRLKIFERDNWTCRRCSDESSHKQIHHLYYKFGLNPWEYPNEALITLCELCHMKAEFWKWIMRHGSKYLLQIGFPDSDLQEVKRIISNNLSPNNHKESAVRYMDDIRKLMQENG